MPRRMRASLRAMMSLSPSTGSSTERVAIRPSSHGMRMACSVSIFSWLGMPNSVKLAGGLAVSHSASMAASFAFCTSPTV